jgi:hypothetical protein
VASQVAAIDRQAAFADNAEARIRCYEELTGFVRGVTESIAETEYLGADGAILPENESDRAILRSLLSLADAVGVDVRESAATGDIPLPVMNFCRSRDDLAAFAAIDPLADAQVQEAAARSAFDRLPAGQKTLLPTVLYVKALLQLRAEQGRTAAEIDAEVREIVNPLIADFLKQGVMPGVDPADGDASVAAADAWAIGELLRIFDLTAERKVPEQPERTKEMFRLFNTSLIHAIKAAG